MTGDEPRSKVGRLIEEHGLVGVGAELEDRWTREEDRWSLRELADWFNKQVLEQSLLDAGLQSIEGEVDNSYRVLTDDDVSEGVRVELRRRLERAGVDAEALTDEFVTYQAVRTYLKAVREAEYERSTATSDAVHDRIQRLAGRTATVAESQIEQLRTSDEVDVGEFSLLVDVKLYCEECNTQYDVAEFFDRGGCACND